MALSQAFADYLSLREIVTRESGRLFESYRRHLRCGRGCYYCCDPINVLPVEIAAIEDRLRTHPVPEALLGGPPGDALPRCHFLGSGGQCTIYDSRPLICRSHGLPLSYRVYEYDTHGREIDPDNPRYTELWCDLNFTEVRDEEMGQLIDDTGAINMHQINLELESINKRFLETTEGERFRRASDDAERFPLSRACSAPAARAGEE